MLEEVHKGTELAGFSSYCASLFEPIIDAAAAGSHANNNIVSLLDCVRKDDRTSLIFEFVEGRDFIRDLPSFTEMNVARYMRELFIALAHVHRCAACSHPSDRKGFRYGTEEGVSKSALGVMQHKGALHGNTVLKEIQRNLTVWSG